MIKDYHGSKKKGDLLIMKLDNAIVNGPTIVALQNYLSQKMPGSLLQQPTTTPSRSGEINEMLNCRSMVPPASLTSLHIRVVSKISIYAIAGKVA